MQREKQFLYPSELIQLVSYPGLPVRWRRAIALAVYLFPRHGELRALRWESVDLEHGSVHFHESFERRTREVKSTKGKRGRRVAIEPALMPLLRVMHEESGGEGFVCPMPNRMADRLRGWLVAAGLTRRELTDDKSATTRPLAWHDLRASGITWRAVRGDEAMKISQAAGHRDLSTTMIYVRTAEALGPGFGEPFPPLPSCLLEGELSAELSAAGEKGRFAGESGAGHGVRTRDIQLGKLALYQLS